MEQQARLSVKSYSMEQDTHRHPFHQIILPLEGGLELETDICADLVDQNKIAVVTADRKHAFRGHGRNRFIILDVPDCDGQPAEVWDAASETPFFLLDEGLRGLTTFARHGAHSTLDPDAFRASLGTLVLHGLAAQVKAAGAGRPDVMLRACAFIHANLSHPITVPDIGRAAGASTGRLHRLFRTWHETTPAGYLNRARLAKARELLTGTDASIAQIAATCGYSEQSALTRALKREAGVTPGALRRALPH